jgi:Mat/Ecp fimbriae outer membrane usher protein
MRRFLRPFFCVAALTINAPALAGMANATLAATGTPEGFDELASARTTMVDVYFGDKKVGEALAVTRPGTLQFQTPTAVLGMLPKILGGPELSSALSAEFPTNAPLVCSRSNSTLCGTLDPDVVGIIYDEERFRVSIFVNPRFLGVTEKGEHGYLPDPDAPLSLTNAVGLNASGTIGEHSFYNFQNRTIIGLGSARIRANTSIASKLGLVVDDFVGEFDRKDLRYSAGLFWSPGNEFTGQRRILGAGVGTQFDTSIDQEALHETSLVVFLPQPARVELLVDGRLVGSSSYSAGNNEIDTSALSDGSYNVVLRIQQANGSVREERRFFVRNNALPPVGHRIFHVYAGVLANTERNRPISASNTLYYQAAAAWRLTDSFALDTAVLGTQQKAMVQVGGWFLKGPARVRAAGLISTAGDKGALLQMQATGLGPLNVSFDLRRIWSADGRPLIPLSQRVESFDGSVQTGVQLANGSYTQATGSIGLRLGDGYLTVVGSYRKDRDLPADYNIGPTINWPVVSRSQLQIVLEASAQKTRKTSAAFVGARISFASGGLSTLSTVGGSFQNGRNGLQPSRSRAVSTFTAQYSHRMADETLITYEGGVDRNIDTSAVRGGGTIFSRFGNAQTNLLHNLEGRGGTQYDLSFQSGFAVGAGSTATWGARNLEPSAIVVSVNGDAPDAQFNVLVDEAVRGRVKPGQRFSLFVPGYRTYKVRLVPIDAPAVNYDTAARDVTLYPGNVKSLSWRAETTFVLFAQAVSAKGTPLANALVQAEKSVSETDENGYFQIDMRRGDQIVIGRSDEATCHITLGEVVVKNDFASVGRVMCQ